MIRGFVSLWGWWGEHFLTGDSSAPFSAFKLFLGEVKSCSDNPLSMTWRSIKDAVYEQLDEEVFYVASDSPSEEWGGLAFLRWREELQ